MKKISPHLAYQFSRIKEKFGNKWFDKDDAIMLSRTDWTLTKLHEAGYLKRRYKHRYGNSPGRLKYKVEVNQ